MNETNREIVAQVWQLARTVKNRSEQAEQSICHMAQGINLNAPLAIDKVDKSELSSVLLLHFGHSTSGISEEVHYFRANTPERIVLHYRDGEIELAEGFGLTPEQILLLETKVKNDLIETPGVVPGRGIFFSALKVTGSFVYADRLKILPVPPHAPKAPDLTELQVYSQHLTVEHPFIVEFPLRGSSNFLVQVRRLERELRKIALLLNVFLEGRISNCSSGNQRHWVHHAGARPEEGYEYCPEGYRYPGFGDFGPSLTQTDNIPPLETMEYYDFFSNPRQELNPPLRVPSLLGTFLDRFEKLNKREQDRMLRAAFWFHHSSSVWRESKSAAYLAIVSCIETLRAPSPPQQGCEKCGAPRGKGAARQFAEFLESVSPSSQQQESVRKELYRMRSALIHGGDLFHADIEVFQSIHPKSTTENYWLSELTSLARRALLGWLMAGTGGWPSEA